MKRFSIWIPAAAYLALLVASLISGDTLADVQRAEAAQRSGMSGLNINAGCAEGRVFVENRTGFLITRVGITVNEGLIGGGYRHTADAIPPGETYRYFSRLFHNNKGEALAVPCESINLLADTPVGWARWNGSR